MTITPEIFDAQRVPRFGSANPERMRLEFWEWMVRAYEGLSPFDGEREPARGMPYWARKRFGRDREASSPVWTFERMGASRTRLADGRVVCVGGEHEDYYDPDFYIYNDVVVLGPDAAVEMYGYPRDVFPPTDFHSASLVGGRLIVIGTIGHPEDRRPGVTPVHVLHLDDYRIESMATAGEAPGWIHDHEARIEGDSIVVSGGDVYFEEADEGRFRRNLEDYALHVPSGTWRRTSDRGWRQFWMSLAHARNEYVSFSFLDPGAAPLTEPFSWEVLLDRSILIPTGGTWVEDVLHDEFDLWRGARSIVDGVPVAVKEEGGAIVMVIEGRMDEAKAATLAEGLRARIEAACGRPCVVRGGG